MTNIERAQEIYFALEAREFDMGSGEFIDCIAATLDKTDKTDLPLSALSAAAPVLIKALEMADAASTVYDSDELTPLQDEIRKAAKDAGVAPSQYVKNAIRAAIAAAKGEE